MNKNHLVAKINIKFLLKNKTITFKTCYYIQNLSSLNIVKKGFGLKHRNP